MSAAFIPFVVDSHELEQLERTLGASGESRLSGLAPLAWHLRQRDGPRAAELAREGRELMSRLELDEPRARAISLRLTLVEAEVTWGLADYE